MLMLKIRTHPHIFSKFCGYNNVHSLTRNFSVVPGGNKIGETVSSETLTAPSNFEKFYIPEPPNAPDIFEPTLQYNSLGEATFESLGLNSYWPTGWVQYIFETLHVSLNIPWWGVIVIGAVATRCLMFPLTIKLRKLNAMNSKTTPEVELAEKKFRDAKLINDYLTMGRASKQFNAIRKGGEYHPYKVMLYSFSQFPIFLAIMMGLRNMATLPVASLQTGGLFWFTDLTMADPYYILPISTMILFCLQIELGADMGKNPMTSSPTRKWLIRGLPVVGAAFTCNFPSALLLYWWTSSALSLTIAGAMKFDTIKKTLKIEEEVPITAPTDSLSKLGFVANWKLKNAQRKVYDLADRIEQDDQEVWVRASSGPVPKTFTYDPTKVKAVQ